MKKAYIAGKVSGLPFDEVVRKFAAKQSELENLGLKVINPVQFMIDYNNNLRLTGGVPLTDECNRKEIMKMCLNLLMDCDEVHLLKDWCGSKGANTERVLARELAIPLVYPPICCPNCGKLNEYPSFECKNCDWEFDLG